MSDTMSKKPRARAASQLGEGEGTTGSKQDHSVHIHQRQKIDFKLSIRERNDLTERQKAVLEAMLEKHTRCVFVDGVYGSGKTYLAVLAALRLLNTGRVDQVIYLRNPIESTTSGKLGFIPGGLSEKMAPYAAPLWDKLEEFLPAGDIQKLEKDGRLEAIPLGFVRGRSWNCKAIIVDEASSMTWDDLMLILTRCGEFTRIFLVGDSLNQNDLGPKAGFRRMVETFYDEESRRNGVHVFELRDQADIVRSALLRFVMRKTGVLKEPPAFVEAEPMFPPK
jgi:phosphate starvation-inducible PhoH-like protein